MIKTKLYNTVLVYTILCLSISTTLLPSNNDSKTKMQQSHTVSKIETHTYNDLLYLQESNYSTFESHINKEHEKEFQLKKNQQENKELKQQIEALIKRKDALQEEVNNKEIEINDLTQEKELIKKQFEEVKKENEDIQEENKELGFQVQQLKEELDFL